MSALNLKPNEKDFSEITVRAWCVFLVIERFNELVLKAGQTKLKGLESMEWHFFFFFFFWWKESIFVFLELTCCTVACCLRRKQTLEQSLASLWKMFSVSTVRMNTYRREGWGKSWAARLNSSSEFIWDSVKGQVPCIPMLINFWALVAHGRKCDNS